MELQEVFKNFAAKEAAQSASADSSSATPGEGGLVTEKQEETAVLFLWVCLK